MCYLFSYLQWLPGIVVVFILLGPSPSQFFSNFCTWLLLLHRMSEKTGNILLILDKCFKWRIHTNLFSKFLGQVCPNPCRSRSFRWLLCSPHPSPLSYTNACPASILLTEMLRLLSVLEDSKQFNQKSINFNNKFLRIHAN